VFTITKRIKWIVWIFDSIPSLLEPVQIKEGPAGERTIQISVFQHNFAVPLPICLESPLSIEVLLCRKGDTIFTEDSKEPFVHGVESGHFELGFSPELGVLG